MNQIILDNNTARQFIYHATFRQNLSSIKKYGLGAKQPKNWDFSRDGAICFSINPDVAYSYCECADEVSNTKYESGIVVLAFKEFNKYKLFKDNKAKDCLRAKNIIISPNDLYVVSRRNCNLILNGRLISLSRVPSYEI